MVRSQAVSRGEQKKKPSTSEGFFGRVFCMCLIGPRLYVVLSVPLCYKDEKKSKYPGAARLRTVAPHPESNFSVLRSWNRSIAIFPRGGLGFAIGARRAVASGVVQPHMSAPSAVSLFCVKAGAVGVSLRSERA